MPPPKTRDLNPTGLGRAIINKKVKDSREQRASGRYTTDLEAASRLQSITQERDLDEFLHTATLAATDFTAERRNVKIVNTPTAGAHNPFLLSKDEEEKVLRDFEENKQRLRVPRRSPWKRSMTPAQVDRQEKDAFLEWRRGLAELQDRDKFLLTPFERNIEVWRQLWRVLERSHLVVQIVDARNPLRFRCEDLEAYVKDVEGPEGEQGTGSGLRRSLLLINKADLLTAKQRRLWADHFDKQGIQYAFFSAMNAAALQQARRDQLAAEEQAADAAQKEAADSGSGEDDSDDGSEEESDEQSSSEDDPPHSEDSSSDEESSPHSYFLEEDETEDPRAKVLSVLQLEDLFTKSAPDLSNFADSSGNPPSKLVVGLVGYPNVGKSSTINALIGEKKVSVSSTPGKTKHFQTIHLSSEIVLCDCPGLVFPQFTTTRADLVCDGVLPIDQLREHTGPTALVVQRIPQDVLEATYGLTLRTKSKEDGGDGKLKAEDLLIPYAIGRGFTRAGQGNPDEARAARFILKDYVTAKLLYCVPPPGESQDDFNAETRRLALLRFAGKKHAPTTRVTKGADTFVPSNAPTDVATPGDIGEAQPAVVQGHKSRVLDQEFFTTNGGISSRPFVQGSARNGKEFSRSRLYPHQNQVADDGTPLTGRRARIAAVLTSAGADGLVGTGKKHHKKPKREKQRSGRGYD